MTDQSIAIVGLSALFPHATSVLTFWNAILNEKDCIEEVPPTHWKRSDYFQEGGGKDKVYATRGGFLPDIYFDPLEYGIPPNTLPSTDTAQLLALVAAKKVLQDAVGKEFKHIKPQDVSVILGVASGLEMMISMASRIQKPVWEKTLKDYGLEKEDVEALCARMADQYTPWVETTFPGLLGNVVAGRIANRLDLGGTNCTVDAACASSLAAIKMAIDDLRLGHSDLVITGGVDALNDIFMYMCFSQTFALSRSGDCRPYAANADGTLLGEGVGMVALRRLADAERDGDKIYAVIQGLGTSSDGRSKSVYAPLAEGQARAIKKAYQSTPYAADEVELVEGHGTGTVAGDAAELQGLEQGFQSALKKGKQGHIALGSIKSQIGHAKSAAGVASLLKVALALHHKVLPATLKIEEPNQALDLDHSAFYLNTKTRPWIHKKGSKRKAALSSFGFGGSNYHLTVEEYIPDTNKKQAGIRPPRFANISVLCMLYSADDLTTLIEKLEACLKDWEQGDAEARLALTKASQLNFSVNHAYRLAFLLKNETSASSHFSTIIEQIKSDPQKPFSPEDMIYFSMEAPRKDAKIAFLCAGQGSQYLNMGAEFSVAFDEARLVWDQSCDLDLQGTDQPLYRINFPAPVFQKDLEKKHEKRLTQTEYAQPAIGAMTLAHIQVLKQFGILPDFCAGHSYGEIPALYAAGVFTSIYDVLETSAKRGQLMAEAAKNTSGAMTAVAIDEQHLKEQLKLWKSSVTIANINSKDQVVISGDKAAIELTEGQLKEAGIRFKRLQVATAFHSSIVSESVKPFEAYLADLTLKSPNCPVFSNTTGKRYPQQPAKIRHRLANQLAHPVRFVEQLEAMYEAGARIFIHVGPGDALIRFVNKALPKSDCITLALDRKKTQDLHQWFESLAKLAVLGVKVDFKAFWQSHAVSKDRPAFSKATVKINGANYKKVYPPGETGQVALKRYTKPHEMVKPELIAPSKSKRELCMSQENKNLMEKEQSPSLQSSRPIRDASWLSAFESLQHRTMEAQKLFQETLMQSHVHFMHVTELALRQLSGNESHMLPLSSPLHKTTVSTVTGQQAVRMPSVAPATSPDMKTSAMQIQTATAPNIIAAPPSLQTTPIASAMQAPAPALPPTSIAQPQPGSMLTSSQANLSMVTKPSGPLVNQTTEADKAPAASNNQEILGQDLKALLCAIVAEKTGYPEEMLEMDMDLESGLGIDSIKRVEILSDLQEKFPALQEVDASELAELNTLQAILDYADTLDDASQGSALDVGANSGLKKKKLADTASI